MRGHRWEICPIDIWPGKEISKKKEKEKWERLSFATAIDIRRKVSGLYYKGKYLTLLMQCCEYSDEYFLNFGKEQGKFQNNENLFVDFDFVASAL